MPPREQVQRFTPVERWTHRVTSALVLVLLATGLALYLPSIALHVGRRPLLQAVHVAAGLLLPLPTLAALTTSEFRKDLAVLNRFHPSDWEWLRRRDRRVAGLAVGKFNAGQKLAAACFAAAGVVMLGTGLMLTAPDLLALPDGLREGATIVHDTVTLALMALLAGHAWLAWQHPEARRAMRQGVMDGGYADRHHPGWVTGEH